MRPRQAALLASALAVSVAACVGPPPGRPGASPPAPGVAAESATPSGLHGRLERYDGLRVLRLWGSPEERGYAHGNLLADEIVALVDREFTALFAGQPEVLAQAHAALPRLIEYPDEIARELAALWRGVSAKGGDLRLTGLDRDLEERDLLLANALDVFSQMGCSGFTVWGEQVVGGGVLSARNFDWPLTGDHLLELTLLVVQEHEDGRKVASVGWPGYVGTVTGVSADGVAASLHVGSARLGMPEPSSWPSAVAARMTLEAEGVGEARIAAAQERIEYTSPPMGFLTHVALPAVPASGSPAVLFETDSRECVRGRAGDGPFIVTNHFQTREDGRGAAGDSTRRAEALQGGIERCFDLGDRRVDVAEAWRMLAEVGVGGSHRFGTLHSLVFRHEPWCFELAVAEHGADGVVAAPSSPRRVRLTRAQVFGGPGR